MISSCSKVIILNFETSSSLTLIWYSAWTVLEISFLIKNHENFWFKHLSLQRNPKSFPFIFNFNFKCKYEDGRVEYLNKNHQDAIQIEQVNLIFIFEAEKLKRTYIDVKPKLKQNIPILKWFTYFLFLFLFVVYCFIFVLLTASTSCKNADITLKIQKSLIYHIYSSTANA